MDPIRALLLLIGIIMIGLSGVVEKYTDLLWRVGWALVLAGWFLPVMKAGL